MTPANHPKRPAKNAPGEYTAFADALKTFLPVPHSEIQSKIEEGKARIKRASVPALGAKH